LSQAVLTVAIPASMVNFIWFTKERCSLCQHLSTWKHKINVSRF